jgi:DNA replication protein DnaC
MKRYGDNAYRCNLMCIDDLGVDHSVGYKADDELVYVQQQINNIYEQGKGLVISTNLLPQEITDKYGHRVASRLLEMCEVIRFDDIDRRIQKPTD